MPDESKKKKRRQNVPDGWKENEFKYKAVHSEATRLNSARSRLYMVATTASCGSSAESNRNVNQHERKKRHESRGEYRAPVNTAMLEETVVLRTYNKDSYGKTNKHSTGANRQCRAPFVFQNIEADCTCLRADIRMPNFGLKLHFGRNEAEGLTINITKTTKGSQTHG